MAGIYGMCQQALVSVRFANDEGERGGRLSFLTRKMVVMVAPKASYQLDH
jgi:hypothetical protein